MAVAVEFNTPGAQATLDKYFELIKIMGTNPEGAHPDPGCLFHWVTSAPGGLRGADVWRTEEEFNSFAAEKLGPMSDQVGLPRTQTKIVEVGNFLTAGG